METKLFKLYKEIAASADNHIFSHRLVVKNGEVKSLGIFRRIVELLAEKGSSQKIAEQNVKVMNNLKKALRDKYGSGEIYRDACDQMEDLANKLRGEKRSIRAVHVKALLIRAKENYKANVENAQLKSEGAKLQVKSIDESELYLKNILGEEYSKSMAHCEEILNNPVSQKFQTDNDLSKYEMYVLIMTIGSYEAKNPPSNVVQEKLIATNRNKIFGYAPLYKIYDMVLEKLPLHNSKGIFVETLKTVTVGTVYGLYNRMKDNKTILHMPCPIMSDKQQKEALETRNIGKVVYTYTSDKARKVQLGFDHVSRDFLVFEHGSRIYVDSVHKETENDLAFVSIILKESEDEENSLNIDEF